MMLVFQINATISIACQNDLSRAAANSEFSENVLGKHWKRQQNILDEATLEVSSCQNSYATFYIIFDQTTSSTETHSMQPNELNKFL